MAKIHNKISNYFAEIPNYLSFFMLPFFTAIVSPILIEMSRSLEVAPEDINLVFVFLAIGTIVGRITLLFYKVKFKEANLIIIFYFILSILTLLLYFAKSLFMLFILYFASGYILGIIMLAAGYILLRNSNKNSDTSLTTATFFMPVGFIAGYLISPAIVNNGADWRNIYILIIFIIFIILILYTVWRKKYNSVKKEEEKIAIKNIFMDKKRNLYFILIVFTMISYVIAESSVSMWTPTYLRMERSLSVHLSGITLSVFWCAIGIGSLITRYLINRFRIYSITLMLAVFSLFSIILLIYSRSVTTIFISISLMGLSFSGLWPLIVSSGSEVYKKGRDVSLNLIFLASSIGSFLAPYLIRVTARISMLLSILIPVFFIGIVVLLAITVIILKRNFKNT